MIPEAPITVLIVVKGKLTCGVWHAVAIEMLSISEVAERAHLDDPLRSTCLDHKLYNRVEVVRVQRPTFVVVAA